MMSTEVTGTAAPARQRRAPLNHPKMLSHGTLECRDVAASRRFYEEFLGLDCVRHSKRSLKIRKGGYWAIVCIQSGDRVRPTRVGNHWGIDLESRSDVDRAHELALQYQEEYGIQKVHQITELHGTYGFYFQDLDGNWWEFQYQPDGRFDEQFARGDVVPM